MMESESARTRAISSLVVSLVSAMVAELLLSTFVPSSTTLASVGRVAVLFLALYTLERFTFVNLASERLRSRDHAWMMLIMVMTIVLIWAGQIVSLGFLEYARSSFRFQELTRESIMFAIPFASGGLIIKSVIGLRYGFLYGVGLSIIAGMYLPNPAVFIPFIIATNLVGCLSLVSCRTRSSYLHAGVKIAILSLPFALASLIIGGDLDSTNAVVRLLSACLGGILCAFVATSVTPLVEYFGGYVTDIRLLEMATLDHPLLKDLSIQAPGTWNHSMVMGMMAESAADEIGANPILSRVSAYFHDIGKMKKPLYFVENQERGENRHDKLSPSMSALIIRSHVKDGIELARKHGVPQAIEDMIPQHHGTSVIEYFYEKARRDAEEEQQNPDEVDITLYTYPGPKPQTREAGLLMLADGIEAATRTLADPSHDRIQGVVQKIINKVFASGQLDECELTLKDLHGIAKAFTRVLTGIYHQRIAYVEPAEKVREDEESRANVDGGPGNTKSKDEGSERAASGAYKEDLKRLGM